MSNYVREREIRQRIVEMLYNADRRLSIKKISDFGPMDYKTAKKYVLILAGEGKIKLERQSNRTWARSIQVRLPVRSNILHSA